MDVIATVIAIGVFAGAIYVIAKQWRKAKEPTQPGTGTTPKQDSYIMDQKRDYVDRDE